MANFLQSIFGGKKATQQPASALRVNSSLQGVPIAICLGGSNRMGGNLIDYFNFYHVNAPSSGGGKGGVFGGGSGKGNSGQYNYFVSLILGLCDGPIAAVGTVWQNGSAVTFSSTIGKPFGFGATFSGELFVGDYAQLPWGYIEAFDPSRAYNYRGLSYGAFANYPLGSSNSLPNITAEITSTNRNAIPGQPDGDVTVSWTQWLTNAHWGVGFPANRMGSLSAWQSYTLSLGIVVSPVVASAIQASALCIDLAAATNAEPCWQDGLLTVVPRGDQPVSIGTVTTITETHVVPANGTNNLYPNIRVGNAGSFVSDGGVVYSGGAALAETNTYAPTGVSGTGSPAGGLYYESGGVYYFNLSDVGRTVLITYSWAATAAYTPDTRPLYDFTLDDFMPNSGTIGQGIAIKNSPLICVRKSRDQMLNNIQVRYLDRNNIYNPVLIELKDEAAITAFGRERPSGIKQYDFFCLASAAQQSATLQLVKEQIPRTFQFTCGRHFLLIAELMGIYTVTDPGQGFARQGVRLIECQENADFSLTWTCEELPGTFAAPEYGTQALAGYAISDNVDAGAVNPPIIFEPPDLLGGGLEVWAAISGVNTAVWGGCYVWISYDGTNYTKIIDPVQGPARMGKLTAPLASVAPAATGQTIDQVNTLSVDLTESNGTLGLATTLDATSLNTAAYVDGEIVAYATATLTGTNKYDLTYLVRGAYLSTIAAHAAGSQFARLDQGIFKLGYTSDRIGATLYLKFQSFNIWQGGLQNLADVSPYTYTLTGSALTYPLPAVANLRGVLVNFVNNLWWDEIVDPIGRPIQYEVRKGASWAGALVVQRQAHPPFTTHGNDTYWVAPVSTPASGLTVYGPATSIVVSIASITFGAPVAEGDYQAIATWDEQATGWLGTFYGGAGTDTSTPGDTLIRTGGAGNILTDADYLNTPNVLDLGGEGSGGYIQPSAHWANGGRPAGYLVQVDYSGQGVPVGSNILTVADYLNDPDILGAASTSLIDVHIELAVAVDGVTYGAWQKYSPGVYYGQGFKFREVLNTTVGTVIAYGTKFKTYVFAPARTDHYLNLAITPSGLNLTFTPDGSSTPAPFNNGPNNSATPIFFGEIDAAAAGDVLTITNLTASGCTIQVLNGGVGQTRTVQQFNVEGY